MAVATNAEQAARTRRFGRAGNRLLVVGGAVLATVLVWVIGEPLLGHDLVVVSPGRPAMDLGLAELAFVALASSLLGWAALAILERSTAHAVAIWTVAALVILAVSFLPFAGVETSGGSKVVLALTHVAVAAVLIPGLRRTSARPAPGR
ncbi:hypothetical protein DMB66_36735 [Actinoplanes sp. ATCC 53533]|uniref:DUF6069 family protein n=1 Tax=Actinoplanes sp. ATCC 53533 TaxID=1288362 RepID=UPI000F765EB8|nr:DUF6069 family protein [Actinoplanes sp. ATCC 53533]RSM54905.1 hypothetical protein DMB66_36735 [Actinoplanes sp. ATCC 53533]